MNGRKILKTIVDFLDARRTTCGLEDLDFALLKTAMLLAAVDGNVSETEIAFFREVAASCRGFDEKSFDPLWKSALRSTGYLFLQSHLLRGDELVRAFLEESEGTFVKEVVLEPTEDRKRAFECLERMASADGDYSDIERACITALAERVSEARNQALSERYSRAAFYAK